MLVNRFAFLVITTIMMIALLALEIQPFVAGAATMVTVMTGYVIIGMVRRKNRLSLLDDDCAPEAFLERTEKQRAITGRNPKLNAFLDVDKAAGLITLGRFGEAKETLLSINKNKLSSKNDSLLVYTINLMLCYYELGEVTLAEEFFETEIPVLPPITPPIVLAAKVLVAERFFYLERYDESSKQFNELLNQKLSKRTRLEILYYLAQIDEKNGNTESALEKYGQVAQEGNQLWIAQKAKEKRERFLSIVNKPGTARR